MKHTFNAKSKLVRWSSSRGSWFFCNFDKKISTDIKALCEKSNGWGQIKVEVTVGETVWRTSLFPAKGGLYCMLIKKAIREAENIKEGDMVKLSFQNI